MMVPSWAGVENGAAPLHCGIANTGNMVPASRTLRAFSIVIRLSGPDMFPSSVRPTRSSQCGGSNGPLRLDFDARSFHLMKEHSGRLCTVYHAGRNSEFRRVSDARHEAP